MVICLGARFKVLASLVAWKSLASWGSEAGVLKTKTRGENTMSAFRPSSLLHVSSLQSLSLLCHTFTMGQNFFVNMHAVFMRTFDWTSDYNKCFLSDCFAGSLLSLGWRFFACVMGKCRMTSTKQEELKKKMEERDRVKNKNKRESKPHSCQRKKERERERTAECGIAFFSRQWKVSVWVLGCAGKR